MTSRPDVADDDFYEDDEPAGDARRAFDAGEKHRTGRGTEHERATYYEAHRDDPDEWDDGVPTPPRRRLASMISVRLTPDEAAAVRRAARRVGMSQSAFLRMAALDRAGSFLTGDSWTMTAGSTVLTLTTDLTAA